MALLHGDEAIDYAERMQRRVWQPGPEPIGLSIEAAKQLGDAERQQLFISLAYSGYVLTDAEDILLQLAADNPYGFELTDGSEHWPGGIGKAKQVRPIRPSQVPDEIRARLDSLRP